MGWRYTLEEFALLAGGTVIGGPAAFSSVSIDTRTLKPGGLFFAMKGEKTDGTRFVAEALAKGAAAVVSAVATDAGACVVVADPATALQQFAAEHRARHRIPVFALTGSCGKTMSKDLSAAVLGSRWRVAKTLGNYNNDLGCPLSLLEIDSATDMAVIELGANHPGEIAALCEWAQPTESAITIIAPAHLEGFGTIERVAEAKGEIMRALPEGGLFYVNADDPRCSAIGRAYSGRTIWFGRSGDVRLERVEIEPSGELRICVHPIGELRLPVLCQAHLTNVLLAVAVGLEHGVESFEEPLRGALGSSTRFRLKRVGDLEVIDDTYNANPASMAAALEALAQRPCSGKRFAALGEMLELGEAAEDLHRDLGALAGRLGLAGVFVRGPHASVVAEAARRCGAAHAEALDDYDAIASAILARATAGDCLLVKGSRGMAMERVIQALERQRNS